MNLITTRNEEIDNKEDQETFPGYFIEWTK